METFNFSDILIRWDEKYNIKSVKLMLSVSVWMSVMNVFVFVYILPIFLGSKLDIAQSEAGCVVKFAEWPTKEQQPDSVVVSVR